MVYGLNYINSSKILDPYIFFFSFPPPIYWKQLFSIRRNALYCWLLSKFSIMYNYEVFIAHYDDSEVILCCYENRMLCVEAVSPGYRANSSKQGRKANTSFFFIHSDLYLVMNISNSVIPCIVSYFKYFKETKELLFNILRSNRKLFCYWFHIHLEKICSFVLIMSLFNNLCL